MPPLNTATIGMAVTPTVVSTLFSHVSRAFLDLYGSMYLPTLLSSHLQLGRTLIFFRPNQSTCDRSLTSPTQVPRPQKVPPKTHRATLLRRRPPPNPILPRLRLLPSRRRTPSLHRPMGSSPFMGLRRRGPSSRRKALSRRQLPPRTARSRGYQARRRPRVVAMAQTQEPLDG